MFSLFHKKSSLAIDINDADIRIVQVSNQVVTYAQSFPIPESAYKNEKILDAAAIGSVLAEALKNIPGTSKEVMFCIPDAQCFIHTLNIKSELISGDMEQVVVAEASK